MKNNLSIGKLTQLSLFTAIALIIFTVESVIPAPVPIPGIKLGLANIITLVVLQMYSTKDALCVLLLRIFLASFFFGQAVYLLYSLAGGLFCFTGMVLINRMLRRRFLFLTSAVGAICHNLGQLLVAFLITQVPGVLVYLPFLLLSGVITGLFTGFSASFSLRFLLPATARLPFSPKGDDDN